MRRAAIGVALLLAAAAAFALLRSSPPAYRSTDGATLTRFTLHSRAVGHDLHELLVLPHALPHPGQGRFLLVLLHGRGGTPRAG